MPRILKIFAIMDFFKKMLECIPVAKRFQRQQIVHSVFFYWRKKYSYSNLPIDVFFLVFYHTRKYFMYQHPSSRSISVTIFAADDENLPFHFEFKQHQSCLWLFVSLRRFWRVFFKMFIHDFSVINANHKN